MWSSRHPRYGRGVAAVLDDFLPDAPYRTRYATTIATDAEATWRAMRTITARDLALTRILVAVRRMSLSTLRPDDEETDRPLRSSTSAACEDEPRTFVLATTGPPWQLRGHLSAPAGRTSRPTTSPARPHRDELRAGEAGEGARGSRRRRA